MIRRKSYRSPMNHSEDAPEAPPLYTPSEDGRSVIGETAVEQEMASTTNITSKDIVIAIMGVTGVGKSTFISYFSKTAKIGLSLESCTTDVSIHEATIGSHKCYLIDTPGFDDTHRSDTDVLREIADWLNRSYQAKIQLSGIVYLQRITDPRVGGSSLKNLRMFKKLCGPKGLSCVVLATTMWSQVPPEDGERRESELMSNKDFWGEMVNQGSTVMRQDQGEISAIRIIQYIIGQRRRMVLDIQEEMASGKTLDETSAGRELEAELDRMRKQHEVEMRELREEMIEAQRANDKKSQEEIRAIRAELQRKLDQDREDRERMRVTMEELQKERDEELREVREKNYERELKHREAMAESALKLKMMELETSHQIERNKLRHEKEMAEWRANEAERQKNNSGCFIM